MRLRDRISHFLHNNEGYALYKNQLEGPPTRRDRLIGLMLFLSAPGGRDRKCYEEMPKAVLFFFCVSIVVWIDVWNWIRSRLQVRTRS